MAETKNDGRSGRRDFLKFASLGTAASTVAIVAASPAVAAVADEEKAAGYRETAHVKAYYELAKF